uniref:gliding motility-associated C-terminal domain-containing protein n=1 Tax=uncultured Draconibacterium sp. TaxID=1573823 RepID=UPI00321653AB
MTFIFLAARFGVAQEAIVVYEGAETNHFVDNHPGNEYLWEVYKSFNPDIQAEPSEFYFTVSENTNTVTIHWLRAGMYYLKVNETDQAGCSNVKAVAVSVIGNNRAIGFAALNSAECYHPSANGFQLSVEAFDNKGQALDASYFPLNVSFTVNGAAYSQPVTFNQQQILVGDEMFDATPETATQIEVKIIQATDNQNGIIQASDKRAHLHTVYAFPEIEFTTSENKIAGGNRALYSVNMLTGNSGSAQYSWLVKPALGTSDNLDSIRGNTADIMWDGPSGIYSLIVSSVDGNGCASDSLIQQIEIVRSNDLLLTAGNDTVIGSCASYKLQAAVSETAGLTYLWEPGENLSDPTSLNPVFTPGDTTTFILTVTNADNITQKDTVVVGVSQVLANAGTDILMEKETTAILDGSASLGDGLSFMWTTNNGVITEGETTANPTVGSAGIYYLQVTDLYGCVATDSVIVSWVSYSPVATDDYDTTAFQTGVSISVLDNDYDPDGNLDPSSLSIVQYPLNGSVYINTDDYTLSYTPSTGFTGNDVFEYRICNRNELCANANVYVLVTAVNFFIPQAFTPNGDNINDYFEIEGIETYQGNSLTVLNRWGKKVYEARNYGISTTPKFWDGKWTSGGGNEDLPTGTYFYVLDLGNGQKPIAGSVYIDR